MGAYTWCTSTLSAKWRGGLYGVRDSGFYGVLNLNGCWSYAAIRYAIRTLLKLAKTTSYDSLLSKVGLKSIEHRRYVQSLLLLHKCVYNFAPNYIKQLFSFRASTYNLRGDMILHLPYFKSKYFHNSYLYNS